MMPQREATSATLPAAVIPFLTAASTLAGTTSWPKTVNPALARFLDMGRPMMPRPINPIVSIRVSSVEGGKAAV
jgi:hypothetical protein